MGKLIRERKKISTKKKFFFLFCNDKKQKDLEESNEGEKYEWR